jgi:hypothetical protein
MRNGIAIIDADARAIDLDETYRKRLPKEFRDRMVIYPSDGFDRLQNGALAARRPKLPSKIWPTMIERESISKCSTRPEDCFYLACGNGTTVSR